MEPSNKQGNRCYDNTGHEKSGKGYTVTTAKLQENGKSLINNKRILLATACMVVAEGNEMLTYFSVIAGVVLYCTSRLDIGQVDAITISQVFIGVSYITAVPGGFIADAYIGRFKTIMASHLLSTVGCTLMTVSAIEYENWGWESLGSTDKKVMFMTGVMCVALGIGGLKANVKTFGAQQVKVLGDRAIRAYFTWSLALSSLGVLISFTAVAHLQQNVSFAWGFFVPMVSNLVSIVIVAMGRGVYTMTPPTGSVFSIACGICLQGGCKSKPPKNNNLPEGSEKRILARAKTSYGGKYQDHLVDGLVSVIRATPFCLLVVMYGAICVQVSSTFLSQSQAMDVRLGDNYYIPAPSLNVFTTVSIMVLVPVIDRVIYPCFEKLQWSLTYLRRIGIGMIFGILAMVTAGVVEIFRKEALQEQSLVQVLGGQNFTASSMSVFVQIPQFVFVGAGQAFYIPTVYEFAYNQAPVTMQGVLIGLFVTANAVGNWVATAILMIVQKVTEEDPWWANDINHCKMEYLMFLLGGLLLLNLLIFCVVAHFYSYQNPSTFEEPVVKHHMEVVVVEKKLSKDADIPDTRFINNVD